MIISNNAKSKGLQYANIYKIKKRVFDFKNSSNELLDLQFEGDNDSFLIINPEACIFEDSMSDSFVP